MKRETDHFKTFQESFFHKMGGEHQFRRLLDHLPDVEYFAKDKSGRFVAASKKTLERVGMQREEDLIGESDTAIHPPSVARSIRKDDLDVMTTRQPLVDRLETLFSRPKSGEWFLTTKLPIFSSEGEVIGIMGFVRPYREPPVGAARDACLQKVVSYIKQHHARRLPVAQLATIANISQRQLNRRFQDRFRVSVQEFVIRTRMDAAMEELTGTDKPIGTIALDNGFYDQSCFTRQFKRHTGETPLNYRRNRIRSVMG